MIVASVRFSIAFGFFSISICLLSLSSNPPLSAFYVVFRNERLALSPQTIWRSFHEISIFIDRQSYKRDPVATKYDSRWQRYDEIRTCSVSTYICFDWVRYNGIVWMWDGRVITSRQRQMVFSRVFFHASFVLNVLHTKTRNFLQRILD